MKKLFLAALFVLGLCQPSYATLENSVSEQERFFGPPIRMKYNNNFRCEERQFAGGKLLTQYHDDKIDLEYYRNDNGISYNDASAIVGILIDEPAEVTKVFPGDFNENKRAILLTFKKNTCLFLINKNNMVTDILLKRRNM